VQWKNRAQFFGWPPKLMRRILVDHARGRLADKRGGGADRLTLGTRTPWRRPPTPAPTAAASTCSR
jgi:hypothetical protein